MHQLLFSGKDNGSLKILCLGAHCDDIEIGCGGTLLKLISDYPDVQVNWVVFTSNDIRREEANKSALLFLDGVKKREISIIDFRDGYLPSVWSDVKQRFEDIKRSYDPDIIFTHYRNDLHQDHRILNELTWNTFRNHLILEYEIPKYDGDLGTPNFFIHLSDEIVKKKKHILRKCYGSQLKKHWFDNELLNAIMRIRGMECVSVSGHAEAFYARKLLM